MTRYDFMLDGSVKDEVSGEVYPDPLSVILEVVPTQVYPSKRLNTTDLSRFWVTTAGFYGNTTGEFMDLLLGANNIPYQGMLSPGDDLLFPPEDDLISAMREFVN